MDIRYAIFDMDGTLVDSLCVWDVLWEKMGVAFLRKEGFRPSNADDKTVRTLTLQDAMKLIHKNYGIGESADEALDFANELILRFYSESVQLKSGVREFLEHLAERGVCMALATATAPTLVKIALEHCGIDKYFPLQLSCAEIGKGKEHPDIYLKACEALGCDTGDVWIFEDSLVAIETAKKLGMNVVGIYDKYNFGQNEIKALSDYYIDDGETLDVLI